MNFAKKLRNAVANNFIEIARNDERPEVVADRANEYDPYPTKLPPAEETFAKKPDLSLADSVPGATARKAAAPSALYANSAEAQIPEAVVVVAPESVDEGTRADEEEENASDSPSPEIPEEQVSPEITPFDGRNLTRFVSETGTVDVVGMLAGAGLPPVPFSAEKAARIIAALPSDLPMKMKRLTVKATLDALDKNIAPQDIVSDAVLKRMHMAQMRDALTEQFETEHTQAQREAARLQAEAEREFARLQAEAQAQLARAQQVERQRDGANRAFGDAIAQIEQVVFFFQPEEEAPQTPVSEEELPPFMRGDTVKKLLKMEGDESAIEGINELSFSERRSRSRRRISVADNPEPVEAAPAASEG